MYGNRLLNNNRCKFTQYIPVWAYRYVFDWWRVAKFVACVDKTIGVTISPKLILNARTYARFGRTFNVLSSNHLLLWVLTLYKWPVGAKFKSLRNVYALSLLYLSFLTITFLLSTERCLLINIPLKYTEESRCFTSSYSKSTYFGIFQLDVDCTISHKYRSLLIDTHIGKIRRKNAKWPCSSIMG